MDTVTQYDIATNPQGATIYRTMDVHEAEANIRCAIELGDTIQEYATTDQAGNPLRVVLHICTSIDDGREPDQGGVYVLPRSSTVQITYVATETKKLTVSTVLIDPTSSSYWTAIRDDHDDKRHDGMRLGDEWVIGWDQQMGTREAALGLHEEAVAAARSEEPQPRLP